MNLHINEDEVRRTDFVDLPRRAELEVRRVMKKNREKKKEIAMDIIGGILLAAFGYVIIYGAGVLQLAGR